MIRSIATALVAGAVLTAGLAAAVATSGSPAPVSVTPVTVEAPVSSGTVEHAAPKASEKPHTARTASRTASVTVHPNHAAQAVETEDPTVTTPDPIAAPVEAPVTPEAPNDGGVNAIGDGPGIKSGPRVPGGPCAGLTGPGTWNDDASACAS